MIFAPPAVPMTVRTTPFDIAQRFLGVKELPGDHADSPFIMSMLTLDSEWPEHDEIPWCSAFCNYVTWLLRLPRSKSLAARSWARVGTTVALEDAVPGFDIVVLSRGANPAHGHVGFYAGQDRGHIELLGGNQGNRVSLAPFSIERLVAVRRVYRS